MKLLSAKDLLPNKAYELARNELRAQVIAQKKHRRVILSDEISLVFENRETLRFQVQEILRAEGISAPDQVELELSVYNAMMPGPAHLQATLFIEVTEEAKIPEALHRLVGLEEALALRFAGGEVKASFESGRSDGERISAVQYIQFRFEGASRAAFLAAREVELRLDHSKAKASIALAPETIASLQADLTAE